MMIVSTLYDLVVMPVGGVDWKDLMPKDDQALKRELTRAFLSYLDVETGSGGVKPRSPRPR